MNERKTPWFSWPVAPVRVGWYDWRGKGVDGVMRLHWNGRSFAYVLGSNWIEMADDESDQWRGLAKEQK